MTPLISLDMSFKWLYSHIKSELSWKNFFNVTLYTILLTDISLLFLNFIKVLLVKVLEFCRWFHHPFSYMDEDFFLGKPVFSAIFTLRFPLDSLFSSIPKIEFKAMKLQADYSRIRSSRLPIVLRASNDFLIEFPMATRSLPLISPTW